jgi:ribosomal-protein-alanine N-acetyltransferase
MQANDYEFFKLEEQDVGRILELERRCFTYPWDEKQYAVGLKHGAFHVFGLQGPQGLAAYISFTVAADEMEVLNIAVQPELRRFGLASRLLRITLGIARNMGAKRGFLDVRETNVPAQKLYGKFGFKQVGVRRKYYPDTREDAWTMFLDMAENTGEDLK